MPEIKLVHVSNDVTMSASLEKQAQHMNSALPVARPGAMEVISEVAVQRGEGERLFEGLYINLCLPVKFMIKMVIGREHHDRSRSER